MTTTEVLTHLIDIHLGEFHDEQPLWRLGASKLSGRGVFAVHDILPGEVIFRERALVVGPTARTGTDLNRCICCHKFLKGLHILCTRGCTLPVCEMCSESDIHRAECDWFNRWKPIQEVNKDSDIVNTSTLRILTAIRVFLLEPNRRSLVNLMQSNNNKCYRQEIIKAAQSFRNFPTTDKSFMDELFRVVGVLNTNAFEASCCCDGQEILVRALFPLTAMLNHECTPNASHFFQNGDLAVVRATRIIFQGEEITTSYTKIFWSNLSRAIFLKMTKQFTCECSRCNDNTVRCFLIFSLFFYILYNRYFDCNYLVSSMQIQVHVK